MQEFEFYFSSKSGTSNTDHQEIGKRPQLEEAEVPLQVPTYFKEKESDTNDRLIL